MRWTVPAAMVGAAALALIVAGFAAAAPATGGPDRNTVPAPYCTTSGECEYRWADTNADVNGYTCAASPDDVRGPCPVRAWTDIAVAANRVAFPVNPVGQAGDTEQYSTSCVPFQFTFTFYTQGMTCAWVHTDGKIHLAAGGGRPAAGIAPTATSVTAGTDTNVVAGFFADMAPSYCSRNYIGAHQPENVRIFAQAFSDRFIVQYDGLFVWDHTPGASGSTCGYSGVNGQYVENCASGGAGPCQWATFEIVLYKDSNNIDVLWKSVAVDPPSQGGDNSVAIGIRDALAPATGLNYIFQNGDLAISNQGIRFYPNHKPTTMPGPYPLAGNILEDASGTQLDPFDIRDEDKDLLATATIDSLPAHGSITPTSGTGPFLYTPQPDFYGTDAFRFHVKDNLVVGGAGTMAHLDSSPVLAAIPVDPVNDAPHFRITQPITGGGIGKTMVVDAYADQVRVGPSVPAPNEEGSQALAFSALAGYDTTLFTTQPKLVRTAAGSPSATVGTTAALVFTGASEGRTTVCFTARDDGGVDDGGVDSYPGTDDPAQCTDIVVGRLSACQGAPGEAHASFYISTDTPRAGQSITFTDDSSALPPASKAAAPIIAWDWDFGDHQVSSDQSPLHVYQRAGTYQVTLTVTEEGCTTNALTRNLVVGLDPSTPGNAGAAQGPVPYAGDDATAEPGEWVTLQGYNKGVASDLVRYTWRQLGGPQVTLLNSTHPSAQFRAPSVDRGQEAILTFGLRLDDGTATSGEDEVTVTVGNHQHRPNADAGGDRMAVRGTLVALNGSASRDADHDPLTFRWLQTSGPAVVLQDPASEQASFLLPVDAEGPLEFRLEVRDGHSVAADTVRIYPVTGSSAADRGFDAVVAGRQVRFAAALDGANMAWDFGDGSHGRGARPTHYYARAGTYVVGLSMVDGTGAERSFQQAVVVASTSAGAPAPAASTPALGAWMGLAAIVAAAWRRRR